MRKNKVILALLALVVLSIPAIALNNQPVSKPEVGPSKFVECTESNVKLYGADSHDRDGVIAKYEWYLNGNYYGEGEVLDVWPVISNNAGTYTFALTVTDDEGATASGNAVLIVTSSPDRTINELRYDKIKGSGIEERDFLIKGDIFQLEVDNKFSRTYFWEYDEKVFQKFDEGRKVKFEVISDDVHEKQKIKVSAFDNCGRQGNIKDIDLEIRSSGQNSLPTAKISPLVKIDEEKSFQAFSTDSKTGQGFDEQNDKITGWKWEVATIKGSVLHRSSSQNPSFTMRDSGVYVLKLWVTDSFGGVGYTEQPFEVNETKNDPSVADASATERFAIQGTNFSLDASRSWDPDGPPEKSISRYEWHDQTYNEKICGTTKPVCVVVLNRQGTHDIRLKVFDAGALGAEPKYSDITIEVMSPSSTPEASPTAKITEQKEVSQTETLEEKPLDPEELLKNASQESGLPISTDSKTTPGMEATIAFTSILVIAVIARKMKK